MTGFQIVIMIISTLSLLGAIVAVHVKSQVDIAKIQVQIKNLEHDGDRKELALLNLEKRNHEEHCDITKKLDTLIQNIKT